MDTSRVNESYRSVHEQGFMPIFVQDDYDSKKLVEACVEAGCKCIEYTLRRRDADKMIPWIREQYPELHLFIGSTLDNDRIVNKMRLKYPQLLTISELADIGVDGFVSMLGWSLESIRKYSDTHVIIPRATTATEAFQQVGAGAHFAKFVGPDINLVRGSRAAPTFDYCPIFFTGGATLKKIPEIIDAGAVVVGAGFDLILRGQGKDISCKQMSSLLKSYIDVTNEARANKFPQLMQTLGKGEQVWLDALPHYHPF